MKKKPGQKLMKQVTLYSSILSVHLSDIMRWCHPATSPKHWLDAAGASLCVCVVCVFECVFAVIIGAFKTEPARWPSTEIAVKLYEMDSSLPPKETVAVMNKETAFFFWKPCSMQLPYQVATANSPPMRLAFGCSETCEKVPDDIIC